MNFLVGVAEDSALMNMRDWVQKKMQRHVTDNGLARDWSSLFQVSFGVNGGDKVKMKG